MAKCAPLREYEGVILRPRLAGSAFAITAVGLSAAGLALDWIAADQHVHGSGTFWLYPFLLGAVLAPAGIGAAIVRRQPHNPIGWILVLGALSLSVILAATPYAWVALDAHPGSLPGGGWAALVSSIWPAFFAWPLAVAFIFPDGRLPSPRWRPFALFATASLTLLVMVLLLANRLEAPFSNVPNPFPLRLPEAIGFLRGPVWLATFASLFIGAAAAWTRYRRSRGVERLQMLWLVYAVMLVPLGGVCFLLSGLLFGGGNDSVVAFLLAMEAAVALAVGVAVTRYRLYEIDRLINRTLVYGVLTVSLGLLYGGVSLVAGIVVGHGSTWTTALAVLTVAGAFRPLRNRAQTGVDWRFDRQRYEGLLRVRAFVEDVRDGRREPEEIGAVLALVLRDPSAELFFRLPASDGYTDRLGALADPIEDGRALTKVERHGQEIGLLRHEHALLERPDLLRSILTAASLAIEVSRLRVEVRLQLAEVEQSRARVVQAGYEERRRLERDLHDGAQQRLVTLGIVLRRLQRSLPREARIVAPALDSAVDEVARVIEDLRKIAAGVRPPRLDEGLAAALADLARGAPIPLDLEATPERLPDQVEAAAYFVICEAVTNAVKHASPSRIRVEAKLADETLRLLVADDGIGGATLANGTGLVGLTDRVEAQGGTLRIDSPPGAGTRIEAELPCGS